MKRLLLLFILLASISYSKETVVTTIHPLKAIIEEITANNADVVSLVPVGSTPHSYSLKPSDAIAAGRAIALFYVADELDSWAIGLETKNRINLFSLLPEELKLKFDAGHSHDHNGHDHHDHAHEEGSYDPHFWTDPIAVKALLPAIADTLGKLDPDNAAFYQGRAKIFSDKIDILHKQIKLALENCPALPIFVYHPSFNYFIKRYKLINGGAIEVNPGSSESPKTLSQIIEKIKSSKVRSIFTESQFKNSTMDIISREAKVNVYELDPIGGVKGREKYKDIMLYNANTLKKAL